MISKEKEDLKTDKVENYEIEAKVDEKVLKEIEEIETKITPKKTSIGFAAPARQTNSL